MTDSPDLDAAALDAARSTLPIYVVAESPDGKVLSHSGDYPEDDTKVWVEGADPTSAVPMGDLYAEFGNDLIAYAEPEKLDAVAAALDDGGSGSGGAPASTTPTSEVAAEYERLAAEGIATREQIAAAVGVTAAQDAPERTADGEVVINPDAPSDPKLALSEDVQQALNEIPARRTKAEADGDTAEVEALDRYAEALRAGKSPADARAEAWATSDAVTAALGDFREALVADGLDPDVADRLIADGLRPGPDAVTAAVCAPGDIARGNPADVLGDPHEALDRLESFLSTAEDVLGITAALNGPGVIARPTVRKAVGGNEEAQAEVVAAFEANYRDDVDEFVEDVLGPRPDPDTPEHDQEAWDDLAAEARLWHARRMAVAAALRQTARTS